MKIKLFILCCLLSTLVASAQEYSSSYNTLRLPVTAHTAALGGQNISLIEDSPAAGWSNPALYANASDLSLALNFMTYAAGSSWMGAHFAHALGERHTLAVGAQMMNFGKMDETDDMGNTIGSISAKDFVVGVGYSYLLSDRWSGGANLKLMVSNLAGYSAMAFAVDECQLLRLGFRSGNGVLRHSLFREDPFAAANATSARHPMVCLLMAGLHLRGSLRHPSCIAQGVYPHLAPG